MKASTWPLVAPDGETVVQQFSPTYPEQMPNIAYGLAQAATKSVQSRSAVKFRVPTSADSGLGAELDRHQLQR